MILHPVFLAAKKMFRKAIEGCLLGSLILAGVQLTQKSPPAALAATGPVASVSLSAPATTPLGVNFTFTLTFANTSAVATDAGYGPFIDLVLPVNGADGSGNTNPPLDGIDFLGATYLGAPVTAVSLTFPGSGAGPTCLNHPYAVDNTNTPLQVCGTPGDKLVTLQLPFGSFVPGQTPAAIVVNASLSNLADMGVALPIFFRGGYMFGATPLNDWCCDPVILSNPSTSSGSWPSSTVAPSLLTLTKDNVMPETETATGPNFPHPYNLTVGLPTGQVINGLLLTDTLPNNSAYLTGTVAATPPGFALLQQPLTPGAQNPPNNALVVNWAGPVTGAAGAAATTNFSFFVPFSDALGAPIVNPLTGACANSVNSAAASASWTPIDPRDSPAPVTATVSAPAVNACALTVQKTAVIITDTGAPGPTPGDIVQYTLNFQVSDFFALNNIVLTDTLSDGQHYYTLTNPTLFVAGNPFTLSAAAMAPANFAEIDHWTGAPAPVPPITGTTDLVFNVSNEMVTRGQATGRLLGGCVPPGGATTPNCSGYNDGPTTGQIVFDAVIQEQFTDNFPSGDQPVDHGDILNDNALAAGAVLTTTAGFAPTGFTTTNPTSATMSIAFGALGKSVYAIGGNTAFTNTLVSPGVTVTYRITYTMPASDWEHTVFTDFLPLPIFNAAEITGTAPTLSGPSVPPAGTFKFGPSDSVFSTFGIIPTLTVNSAANSLAFDYGTHNDDPLNRNTVIDLLFTVSASNQPFADHLLLTNQVNATEGTTNAGTQSANAITQITLGEPLLVFGKAAVATDNPAAVFSPSPVGPVAFNAPGTPGARWSGIINSTNLAASPINSDVSAVDAGDHVTFALIIENMGTSPGGAFGIAIKDTLPAGFAVPGSGLNLRAALGDGTLVNFVDLGGGLFGSGVQLVDNPATGVCQAHSLTNGLNIVILTYDLQLSSSVAAGQQIINTGSLISYTNTPGGPNFLTTPLTDTAKTTIAPAGLSKSLTGTEIVNAANSFTQTVIGELITYTLDVTAPEGLTPNALITDTLDPGLAFVDVLTVTTSPSLTMATPLGTGAAPANTTITNSGGTIVFSPGTLTNVDTDNTTPEVLHIVYRAVPLDAAGNTSGKQLANSAVLGWTAITLPPVSAPQVTVIEPALAVIKSAAPATGDAGTTITFTLSVSHTPASKTDAFDAVLTDVVPSGMTYVPGSFAFVSGTAPVLTDTGALTATWGALTLGSGSTLRFQATLDHSVTPGQILTNTANLQWTSLPGTPGQRSSYNAISTERTGAGGVDSYHTPGSASVTVPTVGLVKSITATSESSTSNVGGIERLAIGEIIRYHLVITVPHGTAPGFQINDALPGGMTFLTNTADIAFVSNGVGMTSTVITPALPGCAGLDVAGSSGNVTPTCPLTATTPVFALGTIVNNDNPPQIDLVVVEFNALVRNIGANRAGTNLNNSFTVRVNGVQNGPPSNTVLGRIQEPSIPFVNNKTASPTTGQAGDTITYTVVYTAASGANNTTAFNTVVTDTLPAELALNPAGVSVVSAGGCATGLTNGSAGNTVTVTLAIVPKGCQVTITYTAVLQISVTPGQVVTNTARINYTSLPAPSGTCGNPTGSCTPGLSGAPNGERDGSGGVVNNYFGASSATVTIVNPVISKTILGASLPLVPITNVAVGEVVTYAVAITLPHGTTSNGAGGVTLVDQLTPGLAYVNCIGVSATSAITTTLAGGFAAACNPGVSGASNPLVAGAGQTITYSLGTLTNSAAGAAAETINLTYTVVALNSAGNTRGLTDGNNATFAWNNGAPQTISASAPTLTIVEPGLVVNKSATPTGGDAGDVVTFTLRVTNSAPSDATAFDVVLTDVVPSGLTYVPASLQNVSGAAATLDDSGAPTLTATWPSLALNQGSTLQFRATLGGAVAPSQQLTNTATVEWTSLPGNFGASQSPYNTLGCERTGDTADCGGSQNTYQSSGSAGITITAPAINKTLESTSLPDTTGSNVTIGEVLTYNLAITLPEGATPSLTLVDALPAGLAFVNGSGSLDTTGFVGVVPAPTITSGGSVTFTFGAITVTPDNNPSNNTFHVRLQALVRDVPGNVGLNPPGQTLLPNFATVQAGSAPLVTSGVVTATVVEPSLALSKAVSPTLAGPNDTVTFTLSLSNTGASTAFDVVVSDPLPNVDFTNITPVSASGGFVAGMVTTGPTTTVVYTGSSLPAGSAAQFTFTAQLTASPTAGQLITNTAVVTPSSTLPGPNPNERTEPPVSASATLGVSLTDLAIAKNDGGSSGVTQGGFITYTLAYTNTGNVGATGVTITETVPVNTRYKAAGSSPGWSCADGAPAGSTCLQLVGALAGGGGAGNVTFVVTVTSPLPANASLITNTASIGDDGQHGVDQTPNDNKSTAITPILPPTAVTLLYFRADGVSGRQVRLAWATAAELNNFGFNLYRASVNDPRKAQLIHFAPSALKGGGAGASYAYTDTVVATGTWWYWLTDIDLGGVESSQTLHPPVSVLVPGQYQTYLPIMNR